MAQHTPTTLPVSGAQRIIRFISSNAFFWIVVGIFVFESAWIALSARYPQAFDEQFHFGIIKLYSTHLSPFLGSQDAATNQFGAITADPSYLYHYLLSFPYRLLTLITSSETAQIIVLRFINIAFLGSSLLIFRKLFGLTKASPAIINSVLFCFALTPVVPLLASQINYDNLMIPLSGLAIYLAARFRQRVQTTQQWSWPAVTQILLLCMLAGLVKYAFLPIGLGVVVWLALQWRWLRRQKRPVVATVWSPAKIGKTVGYVAVLLLVFGLFFQRYGMNVERYHTPTPECDQVLSISQCESYAPWARNYSIGQFNIHLTTSQILTYPFVWAYHVMGELIFTIVGAFSTTGTINYYVGIQLMQIEILAWTIFGAGCIATLIFGRRLLKDQILVAAVMLALFYVAVLGGQNYLDYLHLGYPIAIHGRYLLPVLPIIYLLFALALQAGLKTLPLGKISATSWQLALGGVVGVLLLVGGGGFTTYIVQSNPSWFWPQSSLVQAMNFKAKEILKPIARGSKSY